MKKALPVIILCCLGVLIYSNTFQSSFQFDDEPNILKNINIRNLADLGAIWHNWPTRFVTFFTFALNYHFHKLDVFDYHLTNIIIHIGSAILVWWLISMTLSTPVVKKDRISLQSGLISLLGALIFLCHPIQTESVTYIYQRSASLTGFLYLLSLTFYVKSRLLEINGNPISKIKILYILSLSFGVVAMFTKEHAFTLPLTVVLYEFCFLRKDRHIRWKRILPFLFILLIIPILLFTTKPVTFVDVERLSEQPVAVRYYLLTQLRVMVTYIRLLFIPLNQNLDYNYPISKSLMELPTLASFFLLIVILVAAIWSFSRYRLIFFGIFWFFLTLLPESSIVPLGDLIFEHRLYLPMVGYSLFLVSVVYYLVGKKNLRPMIAILLIFVTGYSILTYDRNFVWKDHFSLWNDTARKSPNKVRPCYNRGNAYLYKGDYDQAISDFNQAIKLNPSYVKAYNNRGIIYTKKGNYDQAISDFNQAIKLNPSYAESYNNRGNVYADMGNYDQAISDYTQALKIDSDNLELHNNRGIIYGRKGNYDQAISDFNQAIKLNPSYPEAYNNRGNIYAKKGNYNQALSDFNQAIKLNPSYPEAYNNRGATYDKRGELDQALSDYNQAIKLSPNYAEAYSNRGVIYGKKGNYDQAILDINQAIKLSPDYPEAYNNRAVTYYLKNEYKKAWEDVHKAEALGKKIDPIFLEDLKKASGRER